jgi:large subunit ribosomal protein L10
VKRSVKEEEVRELSERFKRAQLTVLADYSGLTAGQMTNLRRTLREAQADIKVVKNTLAQLAVKDTEMQVLQDHFKGTTAVLTAEKDPVTPSKALIQFAKEAEKLKIRVGYLSGKLVEAHQIEALSKLPSREQMLSTLLGSMKAPAQNLVGVLAAVPRKLVYALAAIRDKKQP